MPVCSSDAGSRFQEYFCQLGTTMEQIGEILMQKEHDDMKEKVQMYANAYGLDLLGWWVHGNELCITLGEIERPKAMLTKWFSIKRFNALVKKLAR